MGLFDAFKKKAKKEQQAIKTTNKEVERCNICGKKATDTNLIIVNGTFLCKKHADEIDLLAKLRAENAEIIDKHYASRGYGRGEERELTVLFKSENYGFFCVKQIRCLAFLGCAYQIIPQDIQYPSAEMFKSDEGYTSWFDGWFSEYLGSLM